MTFKGKTTEEIQTILDRMKAARKRRADFELELTLAIGVYTELITATNQALFQLRREKAPNEIYKKYCARATKAKVTLANIRRIGQEYNTARYGTEVQDWFRRLRRDLVGTA